nr:MBG-2 domain-containing protein [Pyrinomonadaceae bacterium]
ATVIVNGYTGIYDAAAHGATGSATGVGSVDLSAGLNLGATFTDVPGGTATWTFTGGTNYNDQTGTAAIVINKADATVIVNGYTGIYDAAAHGATGSATGVGSADLSAGLNLGATFTDVPGGTANWTFTGGTNYNDQTGTAAIVVNKADAIINVSGYTGVYNGAAQGATGTTTGVLSEALAGLDLGASFTNVPGGTATWTFTDVTGNYNNATGTAAIVINKADATINVSGYTGVYDGAAHGATGAAIGVESTPADLNSLLHLGASYTNVPGGTANWTFDGNGNYNPASGNATITINKRNITWTTNPNSKTYGDLDPIPLTTGSGSNFVMDDGVSASYSRAAGSNVGDYHITAALSATAAGALDNYVITNNGADFTINRRALTIKADDKIKSFGAVVPFTVSYTTLVNGDTPASLGGTLTFNFADALSTPAGVHNIVPSGLTSSNYTISFASGSLYVLAAPANVSANADAGICAAALPDLPTPTLGTPVPLTPLTINRSGVPAGNIFPVGTTNVTYSATLGSTTVTALQTVTVIDNQLPTITLKSQAIELWAPDHKYQTIQVTDLVLSVGDNCNSTALSVSNVVITRVTSDEPENINSGDGNTVNDMVIAAAAKSVQLRAERDGNKNGRVYWIHLKVTDAAGNVGTAKARVNVAKSQGNNGAAVDSGPSYQVCVGACPPLFP